MTTVLAQPRRLALLVYLATARAAEGAAFHRSDTLLALLWPESDEQRAHSSLNAAIYFLRRALGEGVIVSRGRGELSIDPALLKCDIGSFDGAVDSRDFEDAQRWYRGDFLDGFHISGAPAFEEWMESERERLVAHHRFVLERLATAARDCGDLVAAAAWARRVAATEPLNSRAAEVLIRALVASGDRAGAVQHARAHEALVRKELGTGPSDELTVLIQSLRDRAPQATPGEDLQSSVAAGGRDGNRRTGGEAVSVSPDGSDAKSPASATMAHRRWRLTAILVVALAGVLGLWSLRSGVRSSSPLVTNRVLVAAFENRTGDTTFDALGGLAADWITMGIQQSALAEVIDPVTAFMYTRDARGGATAARVPALARETGAGTVVWGAFYRTGDSLQFSVHLSDATRKTEGAIVVVTGSVSNYSRVVRELRTRVAGALASRLDPQLGSLLAVSSEPPRLEAYQEYIKGLEVFQRQDYESAIRYFTIASDLDSTFIVPRIWALHALSNSGQVRERDSLLWSLVAKELRLAPLDQLGLDVTAAYVREDTAAFEAALRSAARLAPKSNWTFMLADMMWFDRRHEGIRLFESLDPDHGWVKGWAPYYRSLSYWYHEERAYEKELSLIRHARTWNPDRFSFIHEEMRGFAATGRTDEVQARVDAAVARWRAAGSPDGVHVPDTLHTADLIAFAAVELRAHGHEVEAQNTINVAQQLRPIPALGAVPLKYAALIMNVDQSWERVATLLAKPSEWLAQHPADRVNYRYFLALRAIHTGDRATAARISVALLDSVPNEYTGELAPEIANQWGSLVLRKAELRALLGEKAEAVRLLRDALTHGINGIELHRVPAFDSLRDYAPFVELVGHTS
ncbi:MAG: BTAD domain-containing putative transcriptional regulator [Gemmatimonadaceae bacterium]